MKIAICGSLSFSKEIIRIKDGLTEKGHEVLLPHSIEKFTPEDIRSFKNDIEGRKKYLRIAPDFIKKHFEKVMNSDAILVMNLEKNGVKNYIGGNTFAEIMLAFYHGKKIYLLNPVPRDERISCIVDEIEAIKPIILNGNLELIK
jgi:hypothetical protein